MSATRGARRSRDELPTFDLIFRYDDPEAPREVTVYEPEAADLTSTWISVDPQHAVPLERIA